MKDLINLIIVLAGVTLLLCTVFVKTLSSDHCFGLGFIGLMFVVMGWISNNYD